MSKDSYDNPDGGVKKWVNDALRRALKKNFPGLGSKQVRDFFSKLRKIKE